jgi:gamma-glutamyltranspeptidase/glutathione hydrolase
MKSLRLFAAILLVTTFLVVPLRVNGLAGPAAVRAAYGMVASQHELASRVGVDVLKKGGNAIDAAIAVGLALAVVYPEAGNIGGGGFMMIRTAKGEFRVIDYRETAPKAAGRDLYVGPDGQLVKGDGSSTLGYRASGVPGTLAGFEMAFKKYASGKLRWADLVRPARMLAERGFPLDDRGLGRIEADRKGLEKYHDSKRIFLNGDAGFKEGDILRQPELGKVLSRVERLGASEFYRGETAQLIAADMKANNGLITLDDLKNYKAQERAPVRGTYRGYPVISMPPPSSGGAVALEVLNILENYDLGAIKQNSAARYHLIAEAMRRGFADRSMYFGDPAFTKVPLERIIDKSYARERAVDIDTQRASTSAAVGPGNIQIAEGTETTNYCVIDAAGNAVINTYTLNDLFGSKVTIKGTGILMNDEMDDFTTRAGVPNTFGLIQGPQNVIEAGKRPMSSMTPTIVLRKDGSFWFGVGARGGPRITSAVIQTIIGVIDDGLDIQGAIDAPRVHHQWLPDELVYEPSGLSPDTLLILSSYGHKFQNKAESIGSATGIMLDGRGVRLGGVDSRWTGLAVGY